MPAAIARAELQRHSALWRDGLRYLQQPQLRWLIIAPLLLNIAVFGGLSYWLWQWLQESLMALAANTTFTLQSFSGGLLPISWVDGLLDFLLGAAWLLFILIATTLYAFSFTLLAQLIGAPFYALLAERIVALERGVVADADDNWVSFIGAALWRELGKLLYLLPRALGIMLLTLLLSLLPLVGILAPLLLIGWMSWATALQYLDYAADGDGASFATLRYQAGQQRFSTLLFGGIAFGFAALPLLNLLLLPLTVAGGALYWCRRYAPLP